MIEEDKAVKTEEDKVPMTEDELKEDKTAVDHKETKVETMTEMRKILTEEDQEDRIKVKEKGKKKDKHHKGDIMKKEVKKVKPNKAKVKETEEITEIRIMKEDNNLNKDIEMKSLKRLRMKNIIEEKEKQEALNHKDLKVKEELLSMNIRKNI